MLQHPPGRGKGWKGAPADDHDLRFRRPRQVCSNFGSMPARERRMPYTLADLDWAAQAFADAEADRRLDEQALDAAWDDQFLDAVAGTVTA